MATLCIILALSITILIHEFGHPIVLKRNGFKVDKFSLGIPIKSLPSWRIWRDKTEQIIPSSP